MKIVSFTGSSLIYNTSARHKRHECNTSRTLATRVRQEEHECNTSATQTTRVSQECYTNDASATRVKNFGIRNYTSKNIILLHFIYYMASDYFKNYIKNLSNGL